jgi:16S rRNA (adenine1518-N6/adenine1519-N6)-dimethyltransferase
MQKEKTQNYKAKKSLGQNFLKSEAALRKIVEAGEIKRDDVILEIGPGKGALTSRLLEHAGLVIAVEKDRELFELLKIKFQKEINEKKLNLINEDILNLSRPCLDKFKIIANIPYNITGAILKKFLTAEYQPTSMVLMVQNEVAKRIVARDGKESILSVSVKAYGTPKLVMKVEARYFSPAPKVDSAIISIKDISRKKFEVQNKISNSLEFEEKFWEIVKSGFAHKRKRLGGNLKNSKYLKTTGNSYIEKIKDKRAEDLSLDDWLSLEYLAQRT